MLQICAHLSQLVFLLLTYFFSIKIYMFHSVHCKCSPLSLFCVDMFILIKCSSMYTIFYSKQPVDTNKNTLLRICTHIIFPRAQYVLFEKPSCVYMGQSTTKLTRPYLNMAHLVPDPHSSTQRKQYRNTIHKTYIWTILPLKIIWAILWGLIFTNNTLYYNQLPWHGSAYTIINPP
jgi:hypothetical protein